MIFWTYIEAKALQTYFGDEWARKKESASCLQLRIQSSSFHCNCLHFTTSRYMRFKTMEMAAFPANMRLRWMQPMARTLKRISDSTPRIGKWELTRRHVSRVIEFDVWSSNKRQFINVSKMSLTRQVAFLVHVAKDTKTVNGEGLRLNRGLESLQTTPCHIPVEDRLT